MSLCRKMGNKIALDSRSADHVFEESIFFDLDEIIIDGYRASLFSVW